VKHIVSGRAVIFIIQTLAILGLATTVVFTARSAESAAAASLVQNVDEPTRNLYQQQVDFSNCSVLCTSLFSAVPAGKTLRITHVSCLFQLAAGGIAVSIVHSGTPVDKTQYVQVVTQAASPNYFVMNGDINLYSTAGSQPYVLTSATGQSTIESSVCTLSGYYVTNAL
jgi:hypothetical protein